MCTGQFRRCRDVLRRLAVCSTFSPLLEIWEASVALQYSRDMRLTASYVGTRVGSFQSPLRPAGCFQRVSSFPASFLSEATRLLQWDEFTPAGEVAEWL